MSAAGFALHKQLGFASWHCPELPGGGRHGQRGANQHLGVLGLRVMESGWNLGVSPHGVWTQTSSATSAGDPAAPLQPLAQPQLEQELRLCMVPWGSEKQEEGNLQ